jgi:hypothetical protein
MGQKLPVVINHPGFVVMVPLKQTSEDMMRDTEILYQMQDNAQAKKIPGSVMAVPGFFHLVEGGSYLLAGMAYSGKSFFVKGMIKMTQVAQTLICPTASLVNPGQNGAKGICQKMFAVCSQQLQGLLDADFMNGYSR